MAWAAGTPIKNAIAVAIRPMTHQRIRVSVVQAVLPVSMRRACRCISAIRASIRPCAMFGFIAVSSVAFWCCMPRMRLRQQGADLPIVLD